MRQFLLKGFLVFSLALVPNIVMGLLRIYYGDKNIVYEMHKREAEKPAWKYAPYEAHNANLVTDLSKDTLKGVKISLDKYGYSNVQANPHPDILFIGDSYFADLRISSDSGMQASCNRKLGYNASYSIGYPNGSNFKKFNRLISEHFITQPEIIVCGIAERNLNRWSNLKKSLLAPVSGSGNINYFGIDFLFGNNFTDLHSSKIFRHQIHYGKKRLVDGTPVHFIENKLALLPSDDISGIAADLKFVQDYFNGKNTRIYFVIIPDKESLYPGIFGNSQMDMLNRTFYARGVNIVDVYSQLKQDPRRYYFDGDTHWNKNGVEKLMDVLQERGAFDHLNAH